MPERAWRRLSVTSSALLPMEETMPRPVTTTRLIQVPEWWSDGSGSSRGALCQRGRGVGEQADLQPLGFIDHLAIHFHDAVGDAHHQLAHDYALQIDDVGDLLGGGQHHAGELHFIHAQRAAAANTAHPT